MLTYSCQVLFNSEDDKERILKTLGLSKDLFNFFSSQAYPLYQTEGKVRLMALHTQSYREARELFPQSLSQICIKAENDVSTTYAAIKSNKHEIDTYPIRRNPCLRLDKRLSKWMDKDLISVAALGGKRINLKLKLYPKIEELMKLYPQCDPLLYLKNKKVYLAITFNNPVQPTTNNHAVGIDLGMRFLAVTSEGKGIKGNKYNGVKRKIRHLKSKLNSKGTKSAKRHLKKLKRKEANFSKNFCHHLANELLKTEADTIVLEDLNNKKMRTKKHKGQNKSRINQIPFGMLKDILVYKAAKALTPKSVIMVNASYTSQKDCRGIKNGVRKGRRYYASDGKVLDAEINAANNIALKSKLSISFIDPSDGTLKPVIGQATVNSPIVGSVYHSLTSPIRLSVG